jgi:hypothetical protein
VFYVFQWLIIGNIATAIYQSQNEIQLTAWFIAILAATTVLTYEWERCQKLVLINLKKMFA